MRNILTVFWREFCGYFLSAVAYVLLFIFVLLSTAMAFIFNDFLKAGDASLVGFFSWHPWLWMIIGPAIGMRLWSEEQRLGTMELLLTMPVATWHVIVGKFLAACAVILAALLLTFPMVITVYLVGEPDWRQMLAGYMGSFLVGASTVALTCAISSLTRSQVACLLISVIIIFGLCLAGAPPVQEFVSHLSSALSGFMARTSTLFHLNQMSQGVLKLQTLVYFLSVIGFCLFLTSVIIRSKRS